MIESSPFVIALMNTGGGNAQHNLTESTSRME